jgi:hypothetical protein
MSVFKPFTTSDIVSSPFKLNKTFSYNSLSEATGSGIDIFIGENTPQPIFISGSNPTGYISQQDSYLVYNSIKYLYYSNFLENIDGSEANIVTFNNDGTISGGQQTTNFQNYLTTTLEAHRTFPTGSGDTIGVLSIPSNIFGETISPNSFIWESISGIIQDDGEGRLYYNSTLLVGNIIYEHGIILLNPNTFDDIDGYGYVSYGIASPPEPVGIYGGIASAFLYNFTKLEFKSTITIYEQQFKCTLRENEFNYTHNPTTITGSMGGGVLKPFTTEHYFTPYVTTVGLYNNEGDLLAVAKLSQPLPTSPTTDTNIIINLDL